jgi:hypothetical protein
VKFEVYILIVVPKVLVKEKDEVWCKYESIDKMNSICAKTMDIPRNNEGYFPLLGTRGQNLEKPILEA